MSRREYQAAEGRLKESINLRRSGLPNHTYPGRDEDLQTMRSHHEAAGEIPPERGLSAWWRRLVRAVAPSALEGEGRGNR